MATLNVKNFPDGLYRRLKARAKKQGRSVSREVTMLLQEGVLRPPRKYTLNDWKGIGGEIWKGIDIEEYLNKERESW